MEDWTLLHKIREALRQRDARYKLHDVIELDGAVFGTRQTGDQTEVLMGVFNELCHWLNIEPQLESSFKINM